MLSLPGVMIGIRVKALHRIVFAVQFREVLVVRREMRLRIAIWKIFYINVSRLRNLLGLDLIIMILNLLFNIQIHQILMSLITSSGGRLFKIIFSWLICLYLPGTQEIFKVVYLVIKTFVQFLRSHMITPFN